MTAATREATEPSRRPVGLQRRRPVRRIQRPERQQPVTVGRRLAMHRRAMQGINRPPTVHRSSLQDFTLDLEDEAQRSARCDPVAAYIRGPGAKAVDNVRWWPSRGRAPSGFTHKIDDDAPRAPLWSVRADVPRSRDPAAKFLTRTAMPFWRDGLAVAAGVRCRCSAFAVVRLEPGLISSESSPDAARVGPLAGLAVDPFANQIGVPDCVGRTHR